MGQIIRKMRVQAPEDVKDIFMGGTTTLVEGSRLGMQIIGNDLNPVVLHVVKQKLANADLLTAVENMHR